jgi:uncharacterized LabA/DUF88 family protein
MSDKADVFIDGGYFAKVREKLGVYKLSMVKFSDLLCECSNMERLFTFYYDCPPFQSNPPTETEKIKKAGFDQFIYSLRHEPRLQVRLGKLSRIDTVCDACGNRIIKHKQKRVDNLLTVDLTRAIWKDNINEAILVTGDSDFVPAVDEANHAHILTHVYFLNSGNTRIHDELYEACSERTEITRELLEKARI